MSAGGATPGTKSLAGLARPGAFLSLLPLPPSDVAGAEGTFWGIAARLSKANVSGPDTSAECRESAAGRRGQWGALFC